MAYRRYGGGKSKYDPRLDRCLKVLGRWEINGKLYQATIQKYDKYIPKLVFWSGWHDQRSGEYKWSRLNGLAFDIAHAVMSKMVIDEFVDFVSQSEGTEPLAAREIEIEG